MIGAAVLEEVVVGAGQAMVVAEIDVDADGRLLLPLVTWTLPGEVVCSSGSLAGFMTPVICGDPAIAASVRITIGSVVAICPLARARSSRLTSRTPLRRRCSGTTRRARADAAPYACATRVGQFHLLVVDEEERLARPSYSPGTTIGPPWRAPN